MNRIFELTKPAPATEKKRSQDGTTYMYRGMKLIGWIPPKKGITRYLYHLWTFTTFFFGAFYVPVGFVISYGIEFKNFTPGEFLTSLQVAINVYGSSVKCTMLYLMLWRLGKTKILMDKLDERVQGEGDRKKINQMVANCNTAFILFNCVYNGYAGSTFWSAVLTGKTPWSIYNPFLDWRDGYGSMWIQSIFEYIGMLFVVLQDLLADIYPLIFTMIIRSHFDVLKDHVRNLRKDPTKTEDENYQELVNCILDHKMILRCTDMLRPVICSTIFVQFMLIGSVIGLTLINMFFFSSFWRGVASFFHLITVLLQTFPFCYTCNLLIDDSEDLANTIFQSNWADAEHRFKTTLIQFMHHVQRPVIFIAGGIFPISMNSNISVAKFAFSVITIVKQMNLAERFE